MAEIFKVGDRVRLIDGWPYPALKLRGVGALATVVSVDTTETPRLHVMFDGDRAPYQMPLFAHRFERASSVSDAATFATAVVLDAGLPDGNPKTAFGLTKPSVAAVPPVFAFQVGAAMMDGARKYGRFNWREHTITASVYYDAMHRHLAAWYDGENDAADSGVDHLAHAAACIAILLDARETGKLNDDRSTFAGPSAAWFAEHTRAMAAA